MAAQSPYQDPVFLAYLRSQGMSESDVAGELAIRTSSLSRQLARQLPAYDDQAQRSQEGISNSYEDRGMFRSGARLVAQQRQATDDDRAKLNFTAGVTDQLSGATLSTAADVARIRRGTAEEELAARGRVAEAGATAGVR